MGIRAKVIFLVGMVLLGAGTGCRNLHSIDGNWWRSAQPKPEWLHDFVKEKEIKVILNLRGAHPGNKDYDLEVATAGIFKVPVVGIAVSANQPMNRETLLLLLDFLEEHGEEAVLVHCHGGANRSVHFCGWWTGLPRLHECRCSSACGAAGAGGRRRANGYA